jgi:hypothetical protein
MRFWQIFCLAGVLILSGCALNPAVRTTTEGDASLIFGYIDMKESPYELSCVRITQAERSGIAYRQSCMTTRPSGLFYLENIPPMEYHIPFFYAGGKLHTVSSDEKDLIDVPPRMITLVGPFKYKTTETTLGQTLGFSSEKFGLVPTNSPSEKELLQMLLEEVKDPRWKKRIQQKISQLEGQEFSARKQSR